MKYRLGDICTITKGATGIMKAIPGDYTMIALGEMDKTHIEYQFDAKAVIIPLVSSTGHGHASMKRVKYFEGKFALGNILCAVIPNDENFVLAKYLHIYLHWNREELLVSQMKGMANVSLPMNRIADVMVTVPNIEKQKEIVELERILVEKEVEANKLFTDQLTQLENLNQAILQEAVQGKLVVQNPYDESASELLKRIKAEKVFSGKKEKPLSLIKPEEIPFEIPKNWVWCRLGDTVDSTSGGTPDRSNPKYWNGGISWLKSGELKDGLIENESKEKISQEGFKNSSAKLFPKGTLLIALYGATAGKLGILNFESTTNQAVCGFFENQFYETKYLFYYLRVIRQKIIGDSWGQAQPNISQTYLKNLPIAFPPLSEQKRIVAEIEKQLAKTKQLKEHIIANQQATEQLLKALLHQAFEAKEMVEEKPKGKAIELKPTNVDYYRRTVLSAEIVWQLHKEPTLGHLKLQKLIYLCQQSAEMQLPTNFLRQAMGPYDNRLMRSIDKQLKEKKWFEYNKTQVLKYQPLEKAGQHHNDFVKYFSAENESIQFIIDTFKTIKSDIVEIVATLYACINNIIDEKFIFSETLLIQRFYEWSEEKQKFSEKEVKRVFSRMKETGIIPKGFTI